MLHNNNAVELNYDNAFPFDVLRYRQVDDFTHKQIRNLVDTVWNSLPFHLIKKDKDKYREMVKNYVLNLLKAYQLKSHIRISRNKNDHHYEKRYSHIYTTHTIIIKTMDALRENEWIDVHIGFYNKERQWGQQTRITPSEKFINLIESTDGISHNREIKFIPKEVKEVIQLRHKIDKNSYKPLDYIDNKITNKMRDNLNSYNESMKNIFTFLSLSRKELQEMDTNQLKSFNNYLLNGSIEFLDYEIKKRYTRKRRYRKFIQEEPEEKIIESITFNVFDAIHAIDTKQPLLQQPLQEQPEKSPTAKKERGRAKGTTITKTLASNSIRNHRDRCDPSSSDYDESDRYFSIEEILNTFQKYRKFKFRIHYVNMYRAFSDSSKNFNHHGRFYGDIVQSLPKWMRIKITMSREPVVECDYTSIHPTMLYVMGKAVPPENIYMIDKKVDPELRKEYKTVLLISLNHNDPDTMWSAVSSNFRENFGYKTGDERLTKRYIENIYNQLLNHNQPIAKYMNTGVAMDLMNKDSDIAEKIMNYFVYKKIPIRCIHDSFIVPASKEALLRKLMETSFQHIMKTDYVIGITTERQPVKVSKKAVGCPVLNVREKVAPVCTKSEGGEDGPKNDDNIKYFLELSTDKVLYADEVVKKTPDIDEGLNNNLEYFKNIDDEYSAYSFSGLPEECSSLSKITMKNRFEGITV